MSILDYIKPSSIYHAKNNTYHVLFEHRNGSWFMPFMTNSIKIAMKELLQDHNLNGRIDILDRAVIFDDLEEATILFMLL